MTTRRKTFVRITRRAATVKLIAALRRGFMHAGLIKRALRNLKGACRDDRGPIAGAPSSPRDR